MSYSFALEHSGTMPQRAKGIELRFLLHPRLRLEDAEDRALHEAMLGDLVGEALAPLQMGGNELVGRYRLSDPATAELLIEGENETQNVLTAVLRAVDLFARPKPDELEDGSAFDERRLYTRAIIAAITPASGAETIPVEADAFSSTTRLPPFLDGASIQIRFENEIPDELDEAAERFEAFLQNSCGVPRSRIDAWLASGGDDIAVWADEDGGGPILRISDYQGEGAVLAFLASGLSGKAIVNSEEDEI